MAVNPDEGAVVALALLRSGNLQDFESEASRHVIIYV
jgi:hypothetical protein